MLHQNAGRPFKAAGVAGAGLSETQLGFASLTFRRVLPMLQRPAALQALLRKNYGSLLTNVEIVI